MAAYTMKRASKLLLIMLALYVLLVVLFESLLGFYQPQQSNTMVITTFEDDLQANDRVVERLEIEGEIFVAVNHWPRAWARRLRNNPDMEPTNLKIVRITGQEAIKFLQTIPTSSQ